MTQEPHLELMHSVEIAKRKAMPLHILGQHAMSAEQTQKVIIGEFLAGLLSDSRYCEQWPQICRILVQIKHKPNPLAAMQAFAFCTSREGLRSTAQALALCDHLPAEMRPVFDDKLQQIREMYQEDQMRPDTALLKLLHSHIQPRFA